MFSHHVFATNASDTGDISHPTPLRQLGVVLRRAAACAGCAGHRLELRQYGICHASTLGGGMVGMVDSVDGGFLDEVLGPIRSKGKYV